MRRWRSDEGISLIEMIIALLLGTLILSAAITFLITHMRSLEGSDIRENVARNDRYIGALLRRDLQMAGIEIKSETSYGTVGAWPGTNGDTLVILYVPYQPQPAPKHNVEPTESQPPVGEGTCAVRCIEVEYELAAPQELGVGDLARIETEGVRRLILIDDFRVDGTEEWELSWTEADTLLHQPAGLAAGNVQVLVPETWVQKLIPVIYYLDGDRLMRAEALNMDGSPKGMVVAYDVEQFEVSLIFDDGDELDSANPNDTDYSNDFDDIVSVKVVVTVRATRTDPRVNHGELVTKTSEWLVAPRNLRYEKNRVSSG
jgi:hypothetical protein